MTPVQQQNPDGSWGPATPLGWQGSGIDWEAAGNPDAERYGDGPWTAHGYDEDVLVARLEAKTRLRLRLKIWWWHKRHPDQPRNTEPRL